MQETKLKAEKRTICGRKVKNLRKEGLIPANVYGKKTASVSISLKKEEFQKVFSDVGETGIVKLNIEGEKEKRLILIQNLQRDPLSGETLHVDLRQILLTEKISAKVPVALSGEAPAVQQKLGILIQTISEIEVEALPLDLPENFVVEVNKLANVGDQVLLKNLAFDRTKVKPSLEEETVLARIEPLAAEEKVEVPVAEKVPVEGEVPVEGAEPKTEEPKEDQKE
ncbi:50S ribosomal protein L25 [Candidatus Shapirobacteria bacterium CG03_land_8_20_14_0_80_39_12]|uniref:Large ribosomal subunit protein bL25 n=1 Tax=Candidatus Shapirobacteria bacterium CG03_land_8_20_14_0_80_39_12 TaxID=1974879 RepID=A0A2M7BAR7_9BACT|nr:MAG: 50S ribosomal protein L25 [Candidatus Shapirobacteria bacterium CG03_land_8_20_14_0_80_39_12]